MCAILLVVSGWGNASFMDFFLAIRTTPADGMSLALFREFDLLDEEVGGTIAPESVLEDGLAKGLIQLAA